MRTGKLVAPLVDGALVARFWARVYRPSPVSCWLFVGHKNYRQYPNIGGVAAHRLSWFLANGTEPGDMCVCHSCDTPHCVNPSHLWLGTDRDNRLDSREKGRRRGPSYGEGPEPGLGDALRSDPGYIEFAQRIKLMDRERVLENLRPYMGRGFALNGSKTK